MRAETHQIQIHRREIQRHLAQRLHAVAVDQRLLLTGQAHGQCQLLNHAGFIVGAHQADQRQRRGGRQLGQGLLINQAIAVYRHGSRRSALSGQRLGGFQHGRVLGRTI